MIKLQITKSNETYQFIERAVIYFLVDDGFKWIDRSFRRKQLQGSPAACKPTHTKAQIGSSEPLSGVPFLRGTPSNNGLAERANIGFNKSVN